MPCRRKAYKNSKKVRAQGGDKMEECTDEEKSMSQTEKYGSDHKPGELLYA